MASVLGPACLPVTITALCVAFLLGPGLHRAEITALVHHCNQSDHIMPDTSQTANSNWLNVLETPDISGFQYHTPKTEGTVIR